VIEEIGRLFGGALAVAVGARRNELGGLFAQLL
jgi:hypothetical protein